MPTPTQPQGVVICAGASHFLSAAIIATQLASEDLLVEWFHVGDELCAFQCAYIDAIPGVRRIDALDAAWQESVPVLRWWKRVVGPLTKSHLQGFMLKPFALMTCSFQRVLLLDADNFPLQSVRAFFSCAAATGHNSLFWPEWRIDPTEGVLPYGDQAFRWFGAPSVRETHGALTESGTIYADRTRTWSAIVATYMLNYEHPLVYQAFFGDKDTYYVGWHWTNTPYTLVTHRPHGASHTVAPGRLLALVQRHPDTGEPLTLHAVHLKLNLDAPLTLSTYYSDWDGPLKLVRSPTQVQTRLPAEAASAPLPPIIQGYLRVWKEGWTALRQLYTDHIHEYRASIVSDAQTAIQRTLWFDRVTDPLRLFKNLLLMRCVSDESDPQRLQLILVHLLHQHQSSYEPFVRAHLTALTDRQLVWVANVCTSSFFRECLAVLPLKSVFWMLWVRCDLRRNCPEELAEWVEYLPNHAARRWPASTDAANTEVCAQFLRDGFTGTDGNCSHTLSALGARMAESPFRYTQPYFFNFYNATFDTTCNKLLRQQVSAIHRTLFPCLQMDVAKPRENVPRGFSATKRRIGFVSTNFKNHSVARDRHGVIRNLNRDLYDVVVFFFERYEDHYYFRQLWNAGHTNVVLTGNYESMVRQMGAHQLDVLVFCDIGLAHETYLLAHARIAPIQVTTWGHSESSGVSTIDYYVSSGLYERAESAQNDYSETLVAQRSLCTFYDDQLMRGNLETPLREESLQSLFDGPPYLLCAQYLHKLRGVFLDAIREALVRCPEMRMVFINGTNLPKDTARVVSHLTATPDDGSVAVSKERVRVLARMPTGDLYKVMRHAHLVLDSYPHGGCNTSLEAFYCGRVVVTVPFACLRGRFTLGMYTKMGIHANEPSSPIAPTLDALPERLVALWTDDDARTRFTARICTHRHRLFRDAESVHEWDMFLGRVGEHGEVR